MTLRPVLLCKVNVDVKGIDVKLHIEQNKVLVF